MRCHVRGTGTARVSQLATDDQHRLAIHNEALGRSLRLPDAGPPPRSTNPAQRQRWQNKLYASARAPRTPTRAVATSARGLRFSAYGCAPSSRPTFGSAILARCGELLLLRAVVSPEAGFVALLINELADAFLAAFRVVGVSRLLRPDQTAFVVIERNTRLKVPRYVEVVTSLPRTASGKYRSTCCERLTARDGLPT